MLKSAIFITLLSLHNKKNEQIQLIYIAFLRYRSLNILTLKCNISSFNRICNISILTAFIFWNQSVSEADGQMDRSKINNLLPFLPNPGTETLMNLHVQVLKIIYPALQEFQIRILKLNYR